ncbi:caveolin-2 isoform X1 [Austrofundulus limnaeus]|uniref:Caveolin n=1 Tax=Austrofundulus limnaeus TaxID=52670 RepID=A0A2I4B9R0_AUSLI|nr:PREDICTED: caveolin-2-like isoform X1 [Austrofundulus limnaeus]
MVDQRLKDTSPHGEMMEVRVDLHSEELDSTLEDVRPLIHDRDPKRVNSNLKVLFEDVIAEPPSVRSFDKVWLWSHALFEVSRLWCYRFISLLLAVPVSLAAGLLFATLSCLHIWYDQSSDVKQARRVEDFLLIMPCMQLLLINMRWIQTVWASILNVFISPFCSSFGKCCGQIIIHLATNKTR